VRPQHVLAVINPVTGSTPAHEIAARLQREADARGVRLSIEMTRRPGHAVDIVRNYSSPVDTIIAVGGDGTVSDVVTGASDEPLTIAIIPAGSTNIIAKDLGVPMDITTAIHVALGDGEAVDIDIATAGDTTFIHMAGAGFDAAMMRDASRRLKRRIGWLAYLPAGIKHIRYPTFHAEMRIDDLHVSIPARAVLLALGSSIISPRFSVGDRIDRTDGIIDVCVFNPPGFLGTLSSLAWIAVGRPGRSRWHHQFRGKRVSLSADRPVPFEVDGDPLGSLPVEVAVSDRRVHVLVPRREAIPSIP
jgi:diacylglycerol kinase (ATP)